MHVAAYGRTADVHMVAYGRTADICSWLHIGALLTLVRVAMQTGVSALSAGGLYAGHSGISDAPGTCTLVLLFSGEEKQISVET